MANSNLLTSFYFSVKISGKSSAVDAAFQEASGLSKEMGTEDVVSGGENRFKYRLPNGTTYPNLVLKRGIVLAASPLIEWCQKTLDAGLATPVSVRNISLSLLNQDGQACMSWNFVRAYPLKWSMSDLKSQENGVLIETIEFAYQYFEIDDNRDKQQVAAASEADDSRDDQYDGVASLFNN